MFSLSALHVGPGGTGRRVSTAILPWEKGDARKTQHVVLLSMFYDAAFTGRVQFRSSGVAKFCI